MKYTLEGLISYLEASPSPFHAAEAAVKLLSSEGYAPLSESERWEIVPGGCYYVTRNRSAVLAFRVPEDGFAPVLAVASHSDSPMFKIKPRAEITAQNKYVLIGTERYGGGILSTWLDRPLSAAGRLMVRTEDGVEARLVDVGRDCLLIPNLAIHMNRDMNENCKYNPHTDMMPLYGDIGAKGTFDALIADAAGVRCEDVAARDLFVYCRMKPSVWGSDGCYLSAPRIDDLECAYTSLCALTEAVPNGHILMCCVFDNEEVGSATRQGADSTFLSDTVARIADALGADAEAVRIALASSFLVSADNGHALHPAHPEKADGENRPYMNEGVVLKYSANQKYTTDAVSSAIFEEVCRRAGVPTQVYANRSDVPGGSTLGNISGTHVSVPTVDIGLAQLAMHSSYETAGTRDAQYMADALTAFYGIHLRSTGDGDYRIG